MAQAEWTHKFSRQNVDGMEGHFDLVVCCAAPGSKWIANRDWQQDWDNMNRIYRSLRKVSADRFILISTADVFGQPVDSDEDGFADPDCWYGWHRLKLEKDVRFLFPHATIVRLPGLVGPGLKKNAIFDLRNEHRLGHLNPDSVYQWYDVTRLWEDIKDREESLIHICPEPEKLSETIARDFPHLVGKVGPGDKPVVYNLRTKYPKKS